MRLLILVLCVASAAYGKGNSAQTDAEREFMRWDSTLPPRTLDGYHTAAGCNVANAVAKIIAQKRGDDAGGHRYELGEEKSWIFAHRLAEQLGLIEDRNASDSTEIAEFVHDSSSLYTSLARCREAGLVYEGDDSPPRSETAGPNRERTQSAIDDKFARWSENWAVDQYVSGSARIDNMQCGEHGCEAVGHFSFSRGGAVLTIRFSAQIQSVGENEYALGRLCYNDNTTGMSDCFD